jgi:hypothetical protein
VAQHPELIDANAPGIKIPEFWNHINGIDYNAALDQIMLSARNQNEVWIIDHSTTTAQAAGHTGGTHGKGGDLLYRWGDPQMYDAGTSANRMLYQQHNTQWIPRDCPGAGDILVFNNGLQRPAGAYSTIDEFTPPVDGSGNYALTSGSAYGPSSLTWTYVASPATSFYSAEISGTQRLPNGNTLICEGLTGRIFEVTSAGQIVWEYQNPVCDTGILDQGSSLPADPRGGYMTAVFRALKYPMTYAAFSSRTLTPSGTVELYPDWIEIRNPTTSAVDMSGMYLTNDASTPTKWQIPAGVSIPAGGYLLFWADADTDAGSRHTNFTLSASGGSISLYDIDGITRIDAITYGTQITNISYGRNPVATGTWGYITTPTPGAANAPVDDVAPAVSNSVLVLDGPQSVQLVFSEDVASSLVVGDLVLQNLTTGQTISGALLALGYAAGTCTATISFPGYSNGILPDGNYRLTLQAGSVSDIVGNSLKSDVTYDFFILGGDANHDGNVDIRVLYTLAVNWHGTGKTFAQGDFNYDGSVNASDLGILARNWQQAATITSALASNVSALLGLAASLIRAPVRTAVRVTTTHDTSAIEDVAVIAVAPAAPIDAASESPATERLSIGVNNHQTTNSKGSTPLQGPPILIDGPCPPTTVSDLPSPSPITVLTWTHKRTSAAHSPGTSTRQPGTVTNPHAATKHMETDSTVLKVPASAPLGSPFSAAPKLTSRRLISTVNDEANLPILPFRDSARSPQLISMATVERSSSRHRHMRWP